VDKGINPVIFIALICIALLFFTFFAEKLFHKELKKRNKRIKKREKDFIAGAFDEWD
jgi:uncharacterized protein YneF (UPF0154 family)